jgi:hypothetical protein
VDGEELGEAVMWVVISFLCWRKVLYQHCHFRTAKGIHNDPKSHYQAQIAKRLIAAETACLFTFHLKTH